MIFKINKLSDICVTNVACSPVRPHIVQLDHTWIRKPYEGLSSIWQEQNDQTGLYYPQLQPNSRKLMVNLLHSNIIIIVLPIVEAGKRMVRLLVGGRCPLCRRVSFGVFDDGVREQAGRGVVPSERRRLSVVWCVRNWWWWWWWLVDRRLWAVDVWFWPH